MQPDVIKRASINADRCYKASDSGNPCQKESIPMQTDVRKHHSMYPDVINRASVNAGRYQKASVNKTDVIKRASVNAGRCHKESISQCRQMLYKASDNGDPCQKESIPMQTDVRKHQSMHPYVINRASVNADRFYKASVNAARCQNESIS